MSASATDNVGVAGVQFLLDGAALGSEDTTAPYSMTWDTTTVSNGVHTLQARARDTAALSAALSGFAKLLRSGADAAATWLPGSQKALEGTAEVLLVLWHLLDVNATVRPSLCLPASRTVLFVCRRGSWRRGLRGTY